MAVDVTIRVNGQVAAQLTGASAEVAAEVDAAVDFASAMLLTRVKGNASGRPGPNAPTGDYRRSWTRRKVAGGFSVGTNRPQARRLEFGFYGTDSLGRFYQQPPYPHLGPAVDAVAPVFLASMQAIVDRVASGGGGGHVSYTWGILP